MILTKIYLNDEEEIVEQGDNQDDIQAKKKKGTR